MLATISFILISTFTPGPNNISSAALGALHGFRKTLNYLYGITVGFFLVMLLCAWVSASLLNFFPQLESILRYVGAAYTLYLAFGILKASYSFEPGNSKPLGFIPGFMLQLLNPKLMVYSLTLFSTFLAPIVGQPVLLIGAVVLLSLVSFAAISTWTLFGTIIKIYLHRPRARLIVNIALSLFLVYTALELARIL